jgi:hypothetical protein
MKKQITTTVALWAFYGFTLWFCFGAWGLPKDFMPMLWAGVLSSLVLGLALWNTFILYGLNELRKDARDEELATWFRDVYFPMTNEDDKSWDVTIPAPNGFEIMIYWNGAIAMWQVELWDITVKPYAICDRNVFITKQEAIDWFVKTSKTLDKF